MTDPPMTDPGRTTPTGRDEGPALDGQPRSAPKSECGGTSANEFRLRSLLLVVAFAVGVTVGTAFGPWSFLAGFVLIKQ